jgi:hypothetical protein
MTCYFGQPNTLWKRALCYAAGIPLGGVLVAGAVVAIPISIVGGYMLVDAVSGKRLTKYLDQSNARDMRRQQIAMNERPPIWRPVMYTVGSAFVALNGMGLLIGIPDAIKFFRQVRTDYLAAQGKTCCMLVQRGLQTPLRTLQLFGPAVLTPWCLFVSWHLLAEAYDDTRKLLK